MPKKVRRNNLSRSIALGKQQATKLHVSQYEITDEPIVIRKEKLPRPVQDQLGDLFDLLKADPKQAIPDSWN